MIDSGDVLHFQRLLACAGYDPGPLDGVAGPRTRAAAVAFKQASAAMAFTWDVPLDPRSEAAIRTLLPAAQVKARHFLWACKSAGHDVRVLSGTRNYAEQDALYAQGRTAPGSIVTNARGGFSNHNFGIAWDVGVFVRGKYLTDGDEYTAISSLRPAGVEWGGNWNSIKDLPHYQVATGLSLAEVRRKFEAGILKIA